MGAFTVALGLPSLGHPQCTRTFSPSRGIPRLAALNSFPRPLVLSKNLRQQQSQYYHSRRIDLACFASASWPYATEEDQEVRSKRPWSGFPEPLDGGFEVLAMGLGVALSLALAFSKQSAAGVSVGALSLVFLTLTTAALRHQIARLLRMMVAHFNTVQAVMAVQLSSIRNNVIIWGMRNGASVSSPTVESASFLARGQEKKQDESSRENSKGSSSAEIEAALSDISKSVAHLTMVVANLDNKISCLEKAASNNVPSFRSPTSESPQNNKTVEDVTPGPAFTDVEKTQNGTYRIRSVNWKEAVVKDRRINQDKPQVLEGYQPNSEDSLASNRVDVFSASEFDSEDLPSTILYDSRGDRVLLLESRPVEVTTEVGRTNLSQSAPSKFSKPQTRDSSVELFFQDVGVKGPQDGMQSKQENAAVETMELAGFRAPKADSSEHVVQSKQDVAVRNAVENAAQAQVLNSTLAPSLVSSGAQDTVVSKAAPTKERSRHNETGGAQREETSGRRVSRSREYELGGSEGYRAVPTTTLGTASKPDLLKLKRIMSGARVTDEAAPNAWTQNESSMVSEITGSANVSRSGGNSMRDESEGVNDRVGVGREATSRQGVQGLLAYDGQEQSARGRPRPEGSEGMESSSRADYGQRWPREGSSDATGADLGENGSSSDTNEGGNESKRRQGSSRASSGIEKKDSDKERPTSPDRRPPSRASPSYPSERTETFRNLPEPNSDDEGFQKMLDEVEALLKEGREGLEGRIEVGVAEGMLYEAAELCEKAVEVRPSSLVAVGLWGNTLLLHGELKLRLSQNLRSMLPEPPSKSLNKREFKEAEEERLSLESTLQDVGEECEQLLLEAGRKYRLALSMDRTDMRALYNWGLALCYRGQLIAEEGGETAAQDADKVFLAAIDKFEAMIGLSDTYAAGALLNWGLAMRDRSRLRPLGSKERAKILAQAKEIFQEALRLDPNYGQARGAVAACIVELKGLQEYEEAPQKPKEPPASRGFRDWWG